MFYAVEPLASSRVPRMATIEAASSLDRPSILSNETRRETDQFPVRSHVKETVLL